MAYEKCIEAITKAAGRDVTPEEMDYIADRVKALMGRLNKIEARGGDSASALKAMLTEEAELLKQDKLIAKRNIALNSKITEANRQYIDGVWEDDPTGGLKSLVQGTLVDRQGSRDSVATGSASIRHGKVAAFAHELEAADLLDTARSGRFDLQVRQYAEALDNGADVSKFSKIVMQLADIYRRHQDLLVNELNEAGAWIGKLPGRVAAQTHDMYKIAKAAGAQLGEDANFKAWNEFIAPLIDWNRTMLDVNVSDRQKVMRSLWTQFSSGKHLAWEDKAVSGAGKGFANIGKRNSHDRVIHFKDAAAAQTYFERFGIGNSLYETVIHSLDSGGRDLGIMRKLGPNARQNLDRLFADQERKLTTAGRLADVIELQKEYKRLTEKVWPVISGEGSVSDSKALTAVSETVLNFSRMSDLGGMVLSSFGDLNTAASTLNFFGDRTGGGYWARTADTAGALLGALGRGTAKDERALFSEAGLLLEGTHMPVSNMWSDSIIPGFAAKGVQIAYKYFGSQWWQNRLRMNSMVASVTRYGAHAALAIDKLPEGMQAALRQFNISPQEWDLIRGVEGTDFRGHTAITSDNIRSLGTKEARVAADKYQNLVSEIANLTVTAPTAATRAIATQGLKRGTWTGEAMRHLMLYRTYTLGYMTEHLGREMMGYHPDRVGVVEALKRMFVDPKSGALQGTAGLIGGALFYGYITDTLQGLAAGKAPIIPDSPEAMGRVMMGAFTRSGALGLYGDLFSQQVSDQTSGAEYLFGLLGPTAKRLANAVDIGLAVGRGKFDAAERKAWRLFYQTLPGRNLFYLRWATDYMIYNRIAEFLDPGYLQRMEEANEKATGKQYLVRPSEVVPYGGF